MGLLLWRWLAGWLAGYRKSLKNRAGVSELHPPPLEIKSVSFFGWLRRTYGEPRHYYYLIKFVSL